MVRVSSWQSCFWENRALARKLKVAEGNVEGLEC
jgi:hypothetical protein